MTDLKIVSKGKKAFTHDGKCDFDIRPFIPHIQNLVDLSAISDESEIDALLNPRAGVGLVDYAVLLADVCDQCGEIPSAEACLDVVLKADPHNEKALKLKIRILKALGESGEAKKLQALLKSGPPKPAVGTVTPEDVALAYETIEGEFFGRGWKDNAALGKAFKKWAKKSFEDHAEDQDDVVLLEGLIEDEEGGEALADFVNTLPPALRKEAFAGMKGDVLFRCGDQPSAEVRALLQNLDAAVKQLA